MKNWIYAIVGMVFVVSTSCSGSGSKVAEGADSDSAITAQMETQVPSEEVYLLTPDSIGPVKVGADMASLPSAVINLYDVVVPSETPDAVAYTFLLGTVPQFTVYDFMDGKVDVITLEGDSRAVCTPDGELRVGDPFSKVLALKGVESKWASLDDSGIWYWEWNGLYFLVDEMEISEELATALGDDKRPPRAAIFSDTVKIGYIGTGLPY